jgi:hypothetical protein
MSDDESYSSLSDIESSEYEDGEDEVPDGDDVSMGGTDSGLDDARERRGTTKGKTKGKKKGNYQIKDALKAPRATTYTAQALFDQIVNGDIDLDPEYQRGLSVFASRVLDCQTNDEYRRRLARGEADWTH